MKVSILQSSVAIGNREANFVTLRRMMERAMAEKPDAVLLPELWDVGFYPRPLADFSDPEGERARSLLSELAGKYRVNIVGGSVVTELSDGFHNRCYVFDRSGALVATGDKTHLFSPAKEHRVFVPGDTITAFSLDGVKCGLIICYDLRFPECSRCLALEGMEVLFLPAAWPTVRLAHWQLLTSARAVENQVFVAAANGSGTFANGIELGGHSALIDPWGKRLAEAGKGEEILAADFDLAERANIKASMDVLADRRPELYTRAGDSADV